jgi:hypothetical protein
MMYPVSSTEAATGLEGCVFLYDIKDVMFRNDLSPALRFRRVGDKSRRRHFHINYRSSTRWIGGVTPSDTPKRSNGGVNHQAIPRYVFDTQQKTSVFQDSDLMTL